MQNNHLSRAVFLFHTPPYNTGLDRAALDGKKVNYVDLDVHVGSIAVRRFIESKQPLLTCTGTFTNPPASRAVERTHGKDITLFRRRMTALSWRSSGSI